MTDPASVPAFGTWNQADACTLTGGNWAAPLSYLQTDPLAEKAVTTDTTPSSTCLKASGLTDPIRYAGFVDHNLVGDPTQHAPEFLRFRVRTVHSIGGASFNPHSKADSLVTSTNLSGVAADVREKDSSWLTAVSHTANTSVELTMEGASCPLKLGTGLQLVTVIVRRSNGTGGANPTARIEILSGGSLILAGSNTTISSTIAQTLTITWDATALPVPDPNLIGIRVIGTASAVATVETGFVEWFAEYETGTIGGILATVRDSGWIEYTVPPGYWKPVRSLMVLYLIHDFGENVDADEVFLELDIDVSVDENFSAGRLVICEGATLTDAFEQPAELESSWSETPVDPSPKRRMRSGTRSTQFRPYRRWTLPFPFLSRELSAEAIAKLNAAGVRRDILVMREPGQYLWGSQVDLGPEDNEATAHPSLSKTFEIEEAT